MIDLLLSGSENDLYQFSLQLNYIIRGFLIHNIELEAVASLVIVACLQADRPERIIYPPFNLIRKVVIRSDEYRALDKRCLVVHRHYPCGYWLESNSLTIRIGDSSNDLWGISGMMSQKYDFFFISNISNFVFPPTYQVSLDLELINVKNVEDSNKARDEWSSKHLIWIFIFILPKFQKIAR